MPKSSGKKSAQSSTQKSSATNEDGFSDKTKTKELPSGASIENLRKQAKTLLKTLRTSDPTARLSDAQLSIARTYGYASWPRLRQHLTTLSRYTSLPSHFDAADSAGALVDQFISFACLNYHSDHTSRREHARKLLTENPDIGQENIFAAATVGDVATVARFLQQDPGLAKQRGGPHNWEPLLYAVYSRLDSSIDNHSTLEVAKLLLDHGADPNAGFLWDRIYLFTAVTGAFGEGERGRTHQPEHQYCFALARLLLEAGADPNDSQTLYNRMFTGGTRHLELLFEFGLGKGGDGAWYKRLGAKLEPPEELIQQQVAWAARYNQMARMRVLVNHGANINGIDSRLKRTPYELALRNGNLGMMRYLLENGAKTTELPTVDAFSVACINADRPTAQTLLDQDPSLLDQLGLERVELLGRAAESDKRDAVKLMAELGFDLNERKRTAPIHLAASSGHLEMVKLLIELGADPNVRDEEFDGTAHGWAHYSGKTAVVEYLLSLEGESQSDS